MASGGDTFNNRTLAVSFIGEEGMSNEVLVVVISSCVFSAITVLTWMVKIQSKLSSIDATMKGISGWMESASRINSQLTGDSRKHGEQLAEYGARLDRLEK